MLRQDARLDVRGQELARVVARQAERGLREVVGAEGEELRRLAISPARSAARGSSIMVPTRIVDLLALGEDVGGDAWSTTFFMMSSSRASRPAGS
jgi:hypothetical protein